MASSRFEATHCQPHTATLRWQIPQQKDRHTFQHKGPETNPRLTPKSFDAASPFRPQGKNSPNAA